MSEDPQLFPDEFIRSQVESEWRRKIDANIDVLRRAIEQRPRKTIIDVLPGLISGLTVIGAIIGMLWSFMANQNTYQAVNSERLERFSVTLSEIRKNAEQVPLIVVELQNIESRQKSSEEKEKQYQDKLADLQRQLDTKESIKVR